MDNNQTDASANTDSQRRSLRRRSLLATNPNASPSPIPEAVKTQRSTSKRKKVDNDDASSQSSAQAPTAKKTPAESAKHNWKIGSILEARDAHMNWYKARVIQLDEANSRVKIHYLGWNARYDQWLEVNSDAIRPLADEEPEKVAPKVEEMVRDEVVKENEPSERFEIGSRVLAKWIDNQFYAATVGRHVLKNETLYYEVRFEDGVKKQIRFNNAKKLSDEEYERIKQSLAETPKKSDGEVKGESLETEKDKGIVEDSQDSQKAKEGEVQPSEVVNEPKVAEVRKSSRVKRVRTFSDDYLNESLTKSGDGAKSAKIRKVENGGVVKEKEDGRKKEAPLGGFLKSLSAMKPSRNRSKESVQESVEPDEEMVVSSEQVSASTSVLMPIEEEKEADVGKMTIVEVPKEVEAVRKTPVKVQSLLSQVSEASTASQPSQSTFNASNSIACKFADCKKTFRKQSLLDYHIKYHHYEDGRVVEAKNRKRKQSVNDEVANEKPKDVEKTKKGKGDAAEEMEDPYEVISCKCGRTTSEGFMIQCEKCFCWQHGDCMHISEANLPQVYLCWVCEEHREPKRKDFNFESWLSNEKLNEVNPRAKQFLNDCSQMVLNFRQMKYSYECITSYIE